MATNRKLTIASMAAPGWVRINEVANTDLHFTAFNGGNLRVNRSRNGKVYSWDTNTDHIRIYIQMRGPSDLPFITFASSGSGWFELDGFELVHLGTNKLTIAGNESFDPDAIEAAPFEELVNIGRANPE